MYMFTENASRWVEFDDFMVRNYCEPEPVLGPWAAEAEKLAPGTGETPATIEPSDTKAAETTQTPAPTEKPVSTQTLPPALTAEPEPTPSPTINPE
jgi:hypothetical protein